MKQNIIYSIYIVQCRDLSLYTGIATDVARRVEQHNSGNLGAKYTRGRRPVELVYAVKVGSRSQALKEELRIKKLSRDQKRRLLQN